MAEVRRPQGRAKRMVWQSEEYGACTRVLLHAALWAGMYGFLLLMLKLPLQSDWLDPSFNLFAASLLAIVATNHYVVAYGVTRIVDRRRWVAVAGSLLALYMFSAYASSISLLFLTGFFPENEVIALLQGRYKILSFLDLFSLNTLTWLMSFVLPFCVLTLLIKFYKKNLDTSKRNLQLQKINSELELSFLRSQMNPHFFFNTLNSLYSLVFENERASSVILDLSDIMRFSLYEAKADYIPLDREVKFLTDYIRLEELRHGSRVEMDYRFEPNGHGDAALPPLLLINFIENAFKHGINSTVDRAWVSIRLICHEGELVFTVKNSRPKALVAGGHSSNGIGLKNAKRRLEILYPGMHDLALDASNDVFTVVLKLQVDFRP